MHRAVTGFTLPLELNRRLSSHNMNSMDSDIRVRFAPSPTGLLHIGNARTALFNWLFARHHGGTFILRIEDTDRLRYDRESELGVYVSLKWLGLRWDEGPVSFESFDAPGRGYFGPYRQSERLDIYRGFLEELKSRDAAYPCFCTPEELERERREMARQKKPWQYSGKCRSLSREEAERRMEAGEIPAWRLRAGDAGLAWVDDIRGPISWSGSRIGDFIVMRPSGLPTYNFAAVVDDHLMRISHVIRGEDHISNTPYQLLVYRALGWEPPLFAHLPLITGPDNKPLSKRHQASSLEDLYQRGYLPRAVVNFLSLMGWSSPDGEEVMDIEEIVRDFSLDRVKKSPAVLDTDKLTWLNGKHLRELPAVEILDAVRPFLVQAGYDIECISRAWLESALETVRDNLNLCADAPDLLAPFLEERPETGPEAARLLEKPEAREVLEETGGRLKGLEDWAADEIEKAIQAAGRKLGKRGPDLYMPLRAAVSGRLHGPVLAQMIEALGKPRTMERVGRALGEEFSESFL